MGAVHAARISLWVENRRIQIRMPRVANASAGVETIPIGARRAAHSIQARRWKFFPAIVVAISMVPAHLAAICRMPAVSQIASGAEFTFSIIINKICPSLVAMAHSRTEPPNGKGVAASAVAGAAEVQSSGDIFPTSWIRWVIRISWIHIPLNAFVVALTWEIRAVASAGDH